MWEKLKNIFRSVKREISVWRLVMKDERTPVLAKILIWAALAYLVLPFELIPDFIPVIGYLDDILIVSILILSAMQLVAPEIVEDARDQVSNETHR